MLVQSLVASWQPCESAVDRRRCHRLPFEHSIGVTPLVGDEADGELQLALGRDISLGGIAFTHSEPIPNRYVAVTFWHEDGDDESVVTQLTWCRFTRQGDYQSGGNFLRMIELPNPTWCSMAVASGRSVRLAGPVIATPY
jgi:hypothetical protein